MKQTAVEFLEEQFNNNYAKFINLSEEYFKQAKEMENQQNLDMLIKFTDERTFLRKEVTKIWFEQFKKK
jgi:hypothetical protein